MKVEEILMTVDAIRENALCDEIKLEKLNDVEGRVFCEIMKKKPSDYEKIISGTHELSVPIPYSKIYVLYLTAFIAFAQGDYDAYKFIMSEYETAFCDYAVHCIRIR